jgi:hypothetical protein
MSRTLRVKFTQVALRSFGDAIIRWADEDENGWVELAYLGSPALREAAADYGCTIINLRDALDVEVLDPAGEATVRELIRELAAAHQQFGRDLVRLASRAAVARR